MPLMPIYDPQSDTWFIWSTIIDSWMDGCLSDWEISLRFKLNAEELQKIKSQGEEWRKTHTLALSTPTCPHDLKSKKQELNKILVELINQLNIELHKS